MVLVLVTMVLVVVTMVWVMLLVLVTIVAKVLYTVYSYLDFLHSKQLVGRQRKYCRFGELQSLFLHSCQTLSFVHFFQWPFYRQSIGEKLLITRRFTAEPTENTGNGSTDIVYQEAAQYLNTASY